MLGISIPKFYISTWQRSLSSINVSFLTAIFEWPANFSNANPKETLWDIIKRKIPDLQPSTSEKMWIEIQKIYDNIPSSSRHRFVDSLP